MTFPQTEIRVNTTTSLGQLYVMASILALSSLPLAVRLNQATEAVELDNRLAATMSLNCTRKFFSQKIK